MANERFNILKLLIENQKTVFSIRQIAIRRGINYKSAYQNIKRLEQQDIIDLKKHGNSYLCSFNRRFDSLVYDVEHARRENLLKNKDLKVLHQRISKINRQFILLLFGSYAKNTQTKRSDIDLLLITDDKKEFEQTIGLIPRNIHLTTISYSDFKAMLRSKEFTVVSEAIQNNIILFGIEDHYRLMKNAQ